MGHGGASGYLAPGLAAGRDAGTLRSQNLFLNLLVAGISAAGFTKAECLRPRWLFPLLISSFPTALAAAALPLPAGCLPPLAGVALSAAALRFAFHPLLGRRSPQKIQLPPRPPLRGLAGSAVGLLSGLTGVGGGIYPAPLLIFSGWADLRQTAAVSAWFIVVNSAAGLAGWTFSGGVPAPPPPAWTAAAAAGGLAGTLWGSRPASPFLLRPIPASVTALAAAKFLAAGGSHDPCARQT